ncbi:MAG: hypothetical protein GWM98_16830, partial [Nitrospinaceae bacterium]|nr:hypothetical protein [Nitrospinaceae bacterium]
VRYAVSTDQWREGPDGILIDPTVKAIPLNALPRAFLVPAAQTMEAERIYRAYLSDSFDPREKVLIAEPVATKPEP